jgi:hypothetical protein
MTQERRGLSLEMRVGERVTLHGATSLDSDKIVLILEQKDGRKARLRIQAAPSVKVGKPEKQSG